MYHFSHIFKSQRNTGLDPESSKLRSVRCFKCEKFIQCTSLSDVKSNISLTRKPVRNRFRKGYLYSFAFEPRSALRQELKKSNSEPVFSTGVLYTSFWFLVFAPGTLAIWNRIPFNHLKSIATKKLSITLPHGLNFVRISICLFVEYFWPIGVTQRFPFILMMVLIGNMKQKTFEKFKASKRVVYGLEDRRKDANLRVLETVFN